MVRTWEKVANVLTNVGLTLFAVSIVVLSQSSAERLSAGLRSVRLRHPSRLTVKLWNV